MSDMLDDLFGDDEEPDDSPEPDWDDPRNQPSPDDEPDFDTDDEPPF